MESYRRNSWFVILWSLVSICSTATAKEQLPKGDYAIVFGAPAWCGPCNEYTPVVNSLVKVGYPIYEVDIDTVEGKKLANYYGAAKVPTTVYVSGKQGGAIARIIGKQDRPSLERFLQRPLINKIRVIKEKAFSRLKAKIVELVQ